MRPCKLALILLFYCFSVSAQRKAAPVTCASCHRSQALTQPDTQMGRALQLPGDNPELTTHPKLTYTIGSYTYTVETQHGQSQYIVSDGTRSISLPILWSMGAQAQTWVIQNDGRMYESLVSYYPTLNGLFTTVGDEHMDPKTLEEAIGRPLTQEDVTTCFGCHSTNAVQDHKLNLATLKPGLTCEHCHTGSMEHLNSAMHGTKRVDPPSLSDLSTDDISSFCGGCHRSWELVVRAGWKGTSNVRFQPYRLANSKCYNGNDPRISCIACHDPHQKVETSVAYYDSKCLACHTTPRQANAKVCPVSKINCTTCHMPKTPFPGGHFIFTDHQIRIVKPGEPYPD